MEAINVAQGALVVERELAGLVKQFQEWRTNRGKVERIPEALWQAAVALYPRYSVFRIARALRLNFVELRDRIRPRAKAPGKAKRKSTSGSVERLHFMELPAAGGSQSECHLKVRNGRGGVRITLRLKGSGVGQLLETLRGLWGAVQ